ncbi:MULTISPECIES: RNase adapter RapZ [Micrococcaceae]|uniref:GlmZ(SRNA)-inactivating NTPase n=1 Tax=Pseudarthrobacter sulfonivorans TaxID=121292 RepID=A0A0U3PDA8_9MICC|nr:MULTISPECIES: RNase adapter RapZ [Micrococcaceae]ALV43520.1 glmZ(sRNA)-inactivating NTPase [Pseudarthrobacter sulfonivorans]MCO4236476.1 RNase adapter RapZ [Pseudarthrobacter sp. MDT3-28]MCO4249943.1 RNase adapter RapZ [Pseudarthrobacter sp. MDT3-9]MCO4262399.1 RNase adapter RapZ [Pseudarthrobacter sp. MDT3-26]QDG67047.1 RNase adapter RapZ [Pseudarthrobacter sp. NIBRBAC000502772]
MADSTAESGTEQDGLTPVKPLEAELLVVTGMSGAGRSTAADALEDHGWYVVENLPPQMLGTLAEIVSHAPQSIPRLAVVMDVRSKGLFVDVRAALGALAASGVKFRVLFLDAKDDVLVRRFEQGRRPHPLQEGGRILDGIAAEREVLKELRDSSDVVLDTSTYNVHALATAITELFSETGPVALRLNVMSFGFKYGLPVDSNYVADVRFIPNPHWVPQLRPHTGLDKDVSDYVLEAEGVKNFVDRYVLALEPVLDGYRRENKHYATIAVGCTGGKHRSVAVAVELSKKLAQYPRVTVTTTHRDLGRE